MTSPSQNPSSGHGADAGQTADRQQTAELMETVIRVIGDPRVTHQQVMALSDSLGTNAVLFLTAMAAHAAQIRVGRELVDRADSVTAEQRGWLPDAGELGRALGTQPDAYTMGAAVHDSFGTITSKLLEEGDSEERHQAAHQAESLVLMGAALGGKEGQARLAELSDEMGFGVAFSRLHAYFAMLVRQVSRLTGDDWSGAVDRVAEQLQADAR
ncbi:hypothetical protein [Kytococcus sedentarius]|uniref:hypothetical protein n=1 Tax=Kytococcus sedentarius TaxID=1276 RepID=UPI0035BC2FB9